MWSEELRDHITIRYNDVWMNTPNYEPPNLVGEGNLDSDPVYVDPPPRPPVSMASSAAQPYIDSPEVSSDGEEGGEGIAGLDQLGREKEGSVSLDFDCHLNASSPCINTGSNQNAPTDDLDGNPRPVNVITDIGCYEYQGSKPPPPFHPIDVIIPENSYHPGDLFEIYVQFWDTILDWDGYIVIVVNGRVWSVLGSNRLKPGIHPIVRNALEKHEFFSARVFALQVPYGVEGSYQVYGAILPTGTAPTLRNAYGPYSQIDIEPFQVVRGTARRRDTARHDAGIGRGASVVERIFHIFGFLPQP
jgi:hypothetical protein